MSGRWKAVDAALCRQDLSGPQRRFNFVRRTRDYQETGAGRHFWNSSAFSPVAQRVHTEPEGARELLLRHSGFGANCLDINRAAVR